MQTHFTAAQLADSDIREADKILRACVHCGFCTATCPTYALLGDERDSPRGRIYLIKEMLENDRPADVETVKHIDRCLTCLSCMTTCPSGVHYLHLVDHARRRIEQTYRRPLQDRLLRRMLAVVLPNPEIFRFALILSALTKPLGFLLPHKLRAALALAPARLPPRSRLEGSRVFPATSPRRRRVALLDGCAQKALSPQINEATIRLLTRHGCEVVVAKGSGCCGALTHHLGHDSTSFARANIEAWSREMAAGGLDAIVINASGCGTTVKDYGFMFRDDAALAEKAKVVSALARDITELLDDIGLQEPAHRQDLRVAYHAACSLQHGQKVREAPKKLLAAAGFVVLEPAEGHLCCGSAGTYNIMQPEIALRLRDRKVANLESLAPQAVAAGNIGCLTQIASGTKLPVVHTVELLDWATGGPKPAALG
ncbi:glycolate oxidase subunit GlcF [Rhodoblastus acidophilus]|uniref:Glycolate oxidase iron-sulfur subunit n=1 Tax=Candidatus Rhodoblastus alkanivorans TaxID=2954117 RepID=A0ABS9Z130_9HYPH|nr:glycolate oxidase subunit GlcF [Candidatus Rhodoblastus alkanivorans]MCI4680486.1 glycolate oxidase subunit GlcF [Candidatus Rhodoblastus alkanivorans]MCI4681186.1 glycolate oxidase subunit GlcF [Candidatus Rhodoblastus alkanivorans]MDI4642229.1 glycolate oxidase subunit GlcF [Rhodoblastus acidophilus]